MQGTWGLNGIEHICYRLFKMIRIWIIYIDIYFMIYIYIHIYILVNSEKSFDKSLKRCRLGTGSKIPQTVVKPALISSWKRALLDDHVSCQLLQL